MQPTNKLMSSLWTSVIFYVAYLKEMTSSTTYQNIYNKITAQTKVKSSHNIDVLGILQSFKFEKCFRIIQILNALWHTHTYIYI